MTPESFEEFVEDRMTQVPEFYSDAPEDIKERLIAGQHFMTNVSFCIFMAGILLLFSASSFVIFYPANAAVYYSCVSAIMFFFLMILFLASLMSATLFRYASGEIFNKKADMTIIRFSLAIARIAPKKRKSNR